jgi:hypothetical protein
MAKTKLKTKIQYKTTKRIKEKKHVAEQVAVYYPHTASARSSIPLDSVICGDALHVLRNIPDHTIDLVVTSLLRVDKIANYFGGVH